MQNMGKMYYTNTEGTITRTGGVLGFNPGAYLIEAENIYVGYRYYETRYADAVLGQGNASSAAGATVLEDRWDYASEVTYGFGYGLSYTTFVQTSAGEPKLSVTKGKQGSTEVRLTVAVDVANTGSSEGRSVVQIYGQAPYVAGGVEKPAIQTI